MRGGGFRSGEGELAVSCVGGEGQERREEKRQEKSGMGGFRASGKGGKRNDATRGRKTHRVLTNPLMTDFLGQLRLVEMVVFGKSKSGWKIMKFSGWEVEKMISAIVEGDSSLEEAVVDVESFRRRAAVSLEKQGSTTSSLIARLGDAGGKKE